MGTRRVDYKIEKQIALIGDYGNETLELNYVRWGLNDPKYDLRKWEGSKPLKGVTLSRDEAEQLYWALKNELYPGVDTRKLKSEISLDYRSIFVVTSLFGCIDKGHELYEVDAAVPMLVRGKFSEVIFKASYCADCNVYYITESEYEKIKKQGRVLCQILTESEYKTYKEGTNSYELFPVGPLKMLGYTVESGVLTSSERKQILEWIITNEIMEKDKVIYYLEMFMKMNQGRTNMSSAVSKWREDRDYLKGIDSLGADAPPIGVVKFVKGLPGELLLEGDIALLD